MTGFILVLTASEGLAALTPDEACTNDVDNTEKSKPITIQINSKLVKLKI